MSNKGILFILSAPAGTGKTTVVEELMKKNLRLRQSISFTIRPKREHEREGEHYHFVSEEAFLAKKRAGDFLEDVELFGFRYGTSKSEVEKGLFEGFHMILVIDTKGAEKVRKMMPVITIFLLPPSMDVLRNRLLMRRTETEELMVERLRVAKNELNQRNLYDYQVINDRLEDAVLTMQSIILAEEHRTAYFQTEK